MKKDISELPDYQIVLVDTLNLAYRNHYGMKSLEWEGKPTGMLYGFAKFVFKMQKLQPQARIIFLWEGINSKRQILYSCYKISRRKRTTIFDKCLNEIPQFLENAGVDQMYHIGLEADDMAGYIVHSNIGNKKRILLVSTDTDWFQFLRPDYVDIQRRELIEYYSDIHAYLGFPPDRVGLWKVLKGDKADDIGGIKRLPTKLAQYLVNHCRDYKQFRDYPLRKYNPKWRSWEITIKCYWESIIERNAELILFHADWIEESQIVCKHGKRNVQELRKTFEDNGMKSLLKGLK